MFSFERESPLPSGTDRRGREPYQTIRGSSVPVDYGIVRRYEPFFRGIELRWADRHQVVFTDDVAKTSRIIAQYMLHAQGLVDLNPRGALRNLGPWLSATDQELLSGRGDGDPDPRRESPRNFSEVVSLEVGNPAFDDFIDDLYRRIDRPIGAKLSPFAALSDRRLSGAFVDFFEANTEKVLFLSTLSAPTGEAEQSSFYRDFCSALGRLESDKWEFRDVLYRVPPVLWVLPYSLCLPSNPLFLLVASRHYFFNQPFHQWLAHADGSLSVPKERGEREKGEYAFGLHTNRLNIIYELRPYSSYVRRLLAAKGSREAVCAHAGLSADELDYLLGHEFIYQYEDEKGPWYAARQAEETFARLRLPAE